LSRDKAQETKPKAMNIYTQNTVGLWAFEPIIKAMHAAKMLHAEAILSHTHTSFSFSLWLIHRALLAQHFRQVYWLSPEGTPPKDEATPSFIIVDSK
jgi:hypothetical protein